MGSKLLGFRAVRDKLKAFKSEAPMAATWGQYDGLQAIMEDAKSITPVDTGTLRDSGYVTSPGVGGGKVMRMEIGFGGPAGLYVRKQHERTEYNHPNGGQAKFLEVALDRGRALVLKLIAKHVKAFLRNGKLTSVSKRVPASPWEIPSKNPRGL